MARGQYFGNIPGHPQRVECLGELSGSFHQSCYKLGHLRHTNPESKWVYPEPCFKELRWRKLFMIGIVPYYPSSFLGFSLWLICNGENIHLWTLAISKRGAIRKLPRRANLEQQPISIVDLMSHNCFCQVERRKLNPQRCKAAAHKIDTSMHMIEHSRPNEV